MRQSPLGPKALAAPYAEPRRRTSDVISITMEELAEESVSLKVLTRQFGNKTFGILLVFMCLFTTLPLVSSFAGIAITLLGVQMLIGLKRAWLPDRVLERPVPSKHVALILSKFAPRIRAVEKYVRPRKLIGSSSLVKVLNGVVVFLMGVIIIVPIPFINILPTLIIVLLGLGLMESDEYVQICVSSLVIAMMLVFTAVIFWF